jgi:hypothetical protein
MLRRHAVMYSGPLSNGLRPKEIFFACSGRMPREFRNGMRRIRVPIVKTQNEAMQFDEAPCKGFAVLSA